MPQNLVLNIPQSPTINIVTPVTSIGCQAVWLGLKWEWTIFLSLKEGLDQLQANSLSVNHQINRLRVKHEFQKGTAFKKAPLPSTFLPFAILSVPPISISVCWALSQNLDLWITCQEPERVPERTWHLQTSESSQAPHQGHLWVSYSIDWTRSNV